MEEEVKQFIQEGVTKVCNSVLLEQEKISTRECMGYYTYVYKSITQDPERSNKMGEIIYESFRSSLADHLIQFVLPGLLHAPTLQFCSKLRQIQERFTRLGHYFSKIMLRYLERYYITYYNHPSTVHICHSSFYQCLVYPLLDKIDQITLGLSERLRVSSEILSDMIHQADDGGLETDSFLVFNEMINIYQSYPPSLKAMKKGYRQWEKKFLTQCQHHYQSWKENYCLKFQAEGLAFRIQKIVQKVEQEQQLFSWISCWKEAERILIKELCLPIYHSIHDSCEWRSGPERWIRDYLSTIKLSGVESANLRAISLDITGKLFDILNLLNQYDPEDSNMDHLLPYLEGVGSMVRQELKDSVTIGRDDQGHDNSRLFMIEVVRIYGSYRDWIRDRLSDCPRFSHILKTEIKTFFDRYDNNGPENEGRPNLCQVMNNYIHSLVLNSEREGGQLDTHLSTFFQLFQFLADKDKFLEIFRILLARRLLFKKTDLELERTLVLSLKRICGIQYTSRVETMIRDQIRLDTTTSGYGKVRYLTRSHWPELPNLTCHLPIEIQDCLHDYEMNYQIGNPDKKVEWLYLYSCVTIQLTFRTSETQSRKYLLILPIFDASILWALKAHPRDSPDLTMSQLEELLVIRGHNEIIRNQLIRLTIQKLARWKLLLVKSDYLSFNRYFTSARKRIVVPYLPVNVSVECQSSERSQGRNHQDRLELLKAVIVRIMKRRRQLGHLELVQQTRSQITVFQPTARHVKEAVELLIENEYLERIGKKKYRYVA